MSFRLRTHGDSVAFSPMPRPGLPSPAAGLPPFEGGHYGTGTLLHLPPVAPPPDPEPQLIRASSRPGSRPGSRNESTTFARTLYGPEYWKAWATEAEVGSDAAMRRVMTEDHAEQVCVICACVCLRLFACCLCISDPSCVCMLPYASYV